MIDGVSRALKDALLLLFAVAVVVMALVLLLVFRSRWRLLPLGIALMAAAITFGLLALVGGSLTMASIAALPILIGLAVDYAIQYQARFNEAGSVEEACDSQADRPSARHALRLLPASSHCSCRRSPWFAGLAGFSLSVSPSLSAWR